MRKEIKFWLAILVLLIVSFNSNVVFAKKDKGEEDRPHGWSQGEKRGWGDADMPPGLAKKAGKEKKKEKHEKKEKKSKKEKAKKSKAEEKKKDHEEDDENEDAQEDQNE